MFPTAESGFLDPAATLAGRASVAAKPLVQERPDPAEVPIPELAPQWKKLDLAEILKRPAAFLSISQTNSLYKPWGSQAAEKQWERGTLPATIKVVKAARRAPNFKSFSWIGYPLFRENHPQSIFDKVHVRSRRELVAQLFLQQCAPRLMDGTPPGADGWFAAEA